MGICAPEPHAVCLPTPSAIPPTTLAVAVEDIRIILIPIVKRRADCVQMEARPRVEAMNLQKMRAMTVRTSALDLNVT